MRIRVRRKWSIIRATPRQETRSSDIPLDAPEPKRPSSIGNVVYEPGKRGVDLFARMSERPLGTKHDLKCGVELKERFYEIVLVPSPALAHPRFGIVTTSPHVRTV